MQNSVNCLKKFRNEDHKKLFEILKKNFLSTNNAEVIVYALYQIAEHIEKIYAKYIPELINTDSDKTKSEEIFEEIKFNCNEIRQLIETSKLTGLKYWDDESC